MKRNALLFASLLLLALSAADCRRGDGGLRAPGVVQGDTITVRALGGGTVVSLPVVEGQRVARGAPLLEIDRERIDNGLQALELAGQELSNTEQRLREKRALLSASFSYWQRQADRFERLRRDNSVSGEQLEKARLQRQEARTALFDVDKALQALPIQRAKIENQRQGLQITLKDFALRSPVDGVVSERFVSRGEQVLPGAALLEILDVDSLYVETFLEERELGRLALNGPVAIRVDGVANRTFAGTIAFFGRKAEFSPKYILAEKERQALLYQVKVRIGGDRERFKIGMPVTLEFVVAD